MDVLEGLRSESFEIVANPRFSNLCVSSGVGVFSCFNSGDRRPYRGRFAASPAVGLSFRLRLSGSRDSYILSAMAIPRVHRHTSAFS